MQVSIPFIAGQWSLPTTCMMVHASSCRSQSPSLRGSGRFEARPGKDKRVFADVSIPFIAGQWSLHPPPSAAHLRHPGLNPLHCGAVVASVDERTLVNALRDGSQSPSLRGSGRFPPAAAGAGGEPGPVSIPFIAGQWSLPGGRRRRRRRRRVSIPFIAGQWSLPMVAGLARALTCKSQSPSLRGSGRFSRAELLGRIGMLPSQSPSLRGSGRFARERPSSPKRSRLNPLHCGAVVASFMLPTR